MEVFEPALHTAMIMTGFGILYWAIIQFYRKKLMKGLALIIGGIAFILFTYGYISLGNQTT